MLKWTVHPIKKKWKASVIVILFLISLCASIYISFDSLAYLFLSAIILFFSLTPFFLPTTYFLQDDCINVKSIFRNVSRDWSSFKSFYPDKKGVLISPFSTPSRLENFRGLYVRFDDNRSEVLNFIREKIK